jgi:sulfite reductase beta subunit-like hemoprotein
VGEQVKETKAQRIERLKREKNPWECLEEIHRFAREGYDFSPPEWLGTYFRWWGVYTQGDGAGALGGKGGEGKAARYFMLRIRIPQRHPALAPAPHHRGAEPRGTRGASPTLLCGRTSSSIG